MGDQERNGPKADRAPTEREVAAAERAAADVDIVEVGEHYRESTERGANVKGEGEIEPPAQPD